MPTADQDTEPVFVSVRTILTLPEIVPVKLAVRVAFMIQVICMQERKAAKNGSTCSQFISCTPGHRLCLWLEACELVEMREQQQLWSHAVL
jgi:hypothetical protein